MEDTQQIDINGFINKNYHHYASIDFITWEGTDLILKMSGQTGPVQRKNRRISSEEYMKWLKMPVELRPLIEKVLE